MSWRMAVLHTTRYRYDRPVSASYNEARLTPLSTEHQTTIDSGLHVDPTTRVTRYWDYWGTLVHAFDTHVPHDELVVTATSVVDTADEMSTDGLVMSWDGLGDDAIKDRFYEYLAWTDSTRPDKALADAAAELAASAPDPVAALSGVTDLIRAHLAYERGATSVSTSAAEAFQHRRGVCQDFVHVALTLLRAMGIPARYVSGYLHPNPEAAVGEPVVGESHAWVEAWVGDWVAFDPTNTTPVGPRHVLVARGRDYRDVTPLKGVYSGAPMSVPTVAVELTRLG
ncbi:MAG: hypothetical protein QOG03_1958 [Actinomycetota bacterium]|jgi:transglutaminase-like putative cysteine protease|nr:hypothetical protein [Actinomycetota bacterium]